MLSRYLSLFHTRTLIIVLGIFYLIILLSQHINGVTENIIGLLIATFVAFAWNTDASANWKWIYQGVYTDLIDSSLNERQRNLKQARLGKDNPLFCSY
jgi:Na+/H+ antiporter NhaC